MGVAHLDAELGTAARRRVGDEDRRDRPPRLGVRPKGAERPCAVGEGLDSILPSESFAEVPLQQATEVAVVADDGDDRLGGRGAILEGRAPAEERGLRCRTSCAGEQSANRSERRRPTTAR
jgi:hypothetical protein